MYPNTAPNANTNNVDGSSSILNASKVCFQPSLVNIDASIATIPLITQVKNIVNNKIDIYWTLENWRKKGYEINAIKRLFVHTKFRI